MPIFCPVCHFSLSMLYAGFSRVGSWWNFKDVMSPFYRLYYISAGKGRVHINNVTYELTAGDLFLIPKFTTHSYECEDFMSHYYICFFDDLSGGVGIPNPLNMNLQVSATADDQMLIQRYLTLNSHQALIVTDPRKYDNNRIIYENKQDLTPTLYQYTVESIGILLQLFSRFITEESMTQKSTGQSYKKLSKVIQYINTNLDKQITILELAELMHLTTDHFSRVFKKVIGISPCEYIQIKRIERAQILLTTSNFTNSQIAESIGIYSPSQFTRLFTKIAKCSPREYKEIQMEYINKERGCSNF